jgi:GNAT superfamily N-acetyltransferase
MSLEIRPLQPSDWDVVAQLLVRRHARDRRSEPALPEQYEAPEEAQALIASLLDSPLGSGVIGCRYGRPAGFLAGQVRTVSPLSMNAKYVRPRAAWVPYEGHAIEDPDDGELYREMYAALAISWVERGYFSHYVEISPLDVAASDAFNSLGFGRQTTVALRRVSEPVADPEVEEPSPDPLVSIERAGPRDLDAVTRLMGMVAAHHAASPIFMPYLREPDKHIAEGAAELLEDWGNPHFIAVRGGEVLGLQSFRSPMFVSSLATPEGSIYLSDGVVVPEARRLGISHALLRESMEWAAGAGYRWCLLHFLSANISGARFWQANGFWPITHTLVRHVDERIAWAGPALS